MADNFGNQQTRVLSPLDRSWDQTVFLTSVPFLTSELNFIGQIGSLKSQEALTTIIPSGWMKVGDCIEIGNLTGSDLTDREAAALSGQVLTSPSYAENTFKLISKNGSNVAIVNGWKINVRGTSSSDENNIITLSSISSSHHVDFVFLEVWKELVAFEDIVYPDGNVLATPLPTVDSKDEIYYESIGVETSKRVQLKYRVRTNNNESGISLSANPEGFGIEVSPIGGRDPGDPNTTYEFVNQGPLDPGLWVSQHIGGTKTQEEMQADLKTVDGLVYAIPMFAVYRREPGSDLSPFDYQNLHRSQWTKSSGKISERPDDLLLDVVHKEDIIDLRHQIIFPGQDLNSIAQKTIRKIVNGDHTSIQGTGTGSNGSTIEISGGSTLLKTDRIGVTDSGSGGPLMGTPVQISSFKRRAYCNADVVNKTNILIKTTAVPWAFGQSFDLELVPSDTPATVISIDNIYSPDAGFNKQATNVSSVRSILNSGSSPHTKIVTFTIDSGSNLISETVNIYIQYTVRYLPSIDGFKDVPKEFLEVRKVGENNLPIATRDRIVPIRALSKPNTLLDYLNYEGGNYTDGYKFGHELVIYRVLNSPTSTSLDGSGVDGGDFYNYPILGIKSIQRKKLDGSYGSFQTFEVSRSGLVYTITSISGTDEPTTEQNVKITLYTANKFFELSKQGRGVIDSYEMAEFTAVEEPAASGIYYIDTVDKPILAITSQVISTGGVGNVNSGASFLYVNGNMAFVVNYFSPSKGPDVNSNLPILDQSGNQLNIGLPTKIKVYSGATGLSVVVPVLMHSYVLVGEEYSFFYKINPYQGNIKSELTGKIESESEAFITSEGSGSLTLPVYNKGTAVFTQGSRFVPGIGTDWGSYLSSGDYIKVPGSFLAHRIESVTNDTNLVLTELYTESTTVVPSVGDHYEVFKLDLSSSGFTNVIDRMPTYTLNDHLGVSDAMDFGNVTTSYLGTAPVKKVQDPLEALPNDIRVGVNSTAKRGRNGIILTKGSNPVYKLGNLSPEIKYLPTASGLYKKVYQAYIFNKDSSGRLYLLVISGETGNSGISTIIDGRNGKDTVDIFELIGRPVIKTL